MDRTALILSCANPLSRPYTQQIITGFLGAGKVRGSPAGIVAALLQCGLHAPAQS